MNIILISILLILAVIDARTFSIPNIITFPIIVWTMLYTHNYLPVIITFFSMAIIMKQSPIKWERLKFLPWCGGDVKLMMVIAAFKGWMVIPIIIATHLLIKLFRYHFNYKKGMPVTPFSLVATSTIMSLAVALRWIVH